MTGYPYVYDDLPLGNLEAASAILSVLKDAPPGPLSGAKYRHYMDAKQLAHDALEMADQPGFGLKKYKKGLQ